MKKINQITLLSAVLFSGFLLSCTKSSTGDIVNNPTDTRSANPPAPVEAGKWNVSSFSQRGEDKSARFKGVVFVFDHETTNSGTITAAKNNNFTTGSWSYSPAVTYYGSTSNSSMVIKLGAVNPYDLLSKRWNVVSIDSTKISLMNPEIAEDEHLVFSKL